MDIKNSVWVIDKSGIQALFFFHEDKKFRPEDFFKKNNIDLECDVSCLSELANDNYSSCNRNLFTGDSKTSGGEGYGLVINQISGTITSSQLDPSGVIIDSRSSPSTQTLWDSTPFMSNMKNSFDQACIHTARDLGKDREVFILTDDGGILRQAKSVELIKCLRPVDVLKLMVKDKFISWQKGVSVFRKWKEHNWVHGLESYRDI